MSLRTRSTRISNWHVLPRKDKHTCIQTNIHAYKHIHTFRKTISVNQAHAHSWPLASCGHVPGLKIAKT